MSGDLPFVIAVAIVATLTAGGMAVRSVSRIRLRHWAERKLRGSEAALTYLERPQRLLAAASAGVAFTLVLAGVLAGVRAAGWTLVWQLAVLGAVFVFAGQLLPRAIARRWASALLPVLLPVLRLAELAATPVVSLGRVVARRLEGHGGAAAAADDEESERDVIQDLLREGELEGVGEHGEIAIISGVVEFGEKTVGDVMTPRQDIFALEETTDARALATGIAQSAYSRVPIYRGTLDHVVGMVHAFDVLKAGADSVPPLRAVAFADPKLSLNDLLVRMLRERQHLAIVRDAAGQTLGLATLEDLLEELVGDIRDEHDEPAPSPTSPPPAAPPTPPTLSRAAT